MADGYDVSLYVEHQHGLRVPFSELQDFGDPLEGLFVPCLEHLLVLKLDAARQRGHTPKGQKDREDICRLLTCAEKHEPLRSWIFKDYLDDTDLDELKDMAINPQTLRAITGSNHREASKLKGSLTKFIEATKNARDPGNLPPSAGIQL